MQYKNWLKDKVKHTTSLTRMEIETLDTDKTLTTDTEIYMRDIEIQKTPRTFLSNWSPGTDGLVAFSLSLAANILVKLPCVCSNSSQQTRTFLDSWSPIALTPVPQNQWQLLSINFDRYCAHQFP